MPTIKDVIKVAGGPAEVAKICGVSERAVYKWISNSALPRTEFSGETHYCQKLAQIQERFSVHQILEISRPHSRSKKAA